MNEISIKLQKVRRFMSKRKLAAVLYGNLNNFAWLTGGKEAHVLLAGEGAVASLLVTPRRAFVLANNIECKRMHGEEISSRLWEPLVFPWHEADKAGALMRKVVGRGVVASDNGAHGTRNLGADLGRLRWQLLPPEIKRYRELGEITSGSLEKTCRAIKPGMTEHEITARLVSEVMKQGAIPYVALVGTDERIHRYRHSIPKDKKLRRHALLVMCARKYGLIAAATRIVHFGKLPREIRKRHNAVCVVDIAFNLATRPGASSRDVFKAGMDAYAEQGYPGEWKLHHQGGATGYAGREWFGTPTLKETVLENQAFAWNPSITGTKSEDTVLVTKEGMEVLTLAGERWPMVHFHHPEGCIERPDILVR